MGEANEAAETEITTEVTGAAGETAGQGGGATIIAETDQNGTTAEPVDPDPLATVLADAAVEETEKFIPSLPPDAAEALKGWLRLNIIWVQTEMEHAKLGTPVEDRAKLNP